MLLDDVEQRVASRRLCTLRAPRADLQVSMQKRGVRPAVGNAVLFATHRAHAYSTERIDALIVLALRIETLRELPAKRSDAVIIRQIGAVFEREMRHVNSPLIDQAGSG